MKTTAMHRVLAAILTLVLLPMLSLGSVALAEDGAQGCNHNHDDLCGWAAAQPGTPCTFIHDVHNEDCGYDAEGGIPCAVEASHEHDVLCGYADPVPETPCNHEHDALCGGLVQPTAPEATITFHIAMDEGAPLPLYVVEGIPVTDAALLEGVSACDELGTPVPVRVHDIGGLDMQKPAMNGGSFPFPPYIITYAAEHPVSGEVFYERRECFVKVGGVVGVADPVDYNGLQDSIDEADDGDTITLGGSITGNTQLEIDKDIILDLNGHTLTITVSSKNGIKLNNGAKLTIMDSSPGSNGTLNVRNNSSDPLSGAGAGINTTDGKLIVEGGNIVAQGINGGAGIGGGDGDDGGIIIINDGSVVANGGSNSAGIGGGSNGNGGSITITSGNVTANGGVRGAGIGSGSDSDNGGEITIEDGVVTAYGGDNGAGIGGGYGAHGGTINISGGTVNAVGGKAYNVLFPAGAGIGGGVAGGSGSIIISGGIITAMGGASEYNYAHSGAGIGSGGSMNDFSAEDASDITISTDATINAKGGVGSGGARAGNNIGLGGQRPSPTVPQNLEATAGDGEVTLTWDAPDNIGYSASNITCYNIRYWVVTPKGFTKINDNINGIDLTELTYTISGLTNGTEYAFEVYAVNDNINNGYNQYGPEATVKAKPTGPVSTTKPTQPLQPMTLFGYPAPSYGTIPAYGVGVPYTVYNGVMTLNLTAPLLDGILSAAGGISTMGINASMLADVRSLNILFPPAWFIEHPGADIAVQSRIGGIYLDDNLARHFAPYAAASVTLAGGSLTFIASQSGRALYWSDAMNPVRLFLPHTLPANADANAVALYDRVAGTPISHSFYQNGMVFGAVPGTGTYEGRQVSVKHGGMEGDNLYALSHGLFPAAAGVPLDPDAPLDYAGLAAALTALAGADMGGMMDDLLTEHGLAAQDRVTGEYMALALERYARALSLSIPKTFTVASSESALTRAESASILRRFITSVTVGELGWVRDDNGGWRYIQRDYALARGWLNTADGARYYMNADGTRLQNTWAQIGGKWFFFYEDGTLAVSTAVDGFTVGADGARAG